jgi:hypothetical protein
MQIVFILLDGYRNAARFIYSAILVRIWTTLNVASNAIMAGSAIFAVWFGYHQIEIQRQMQAEALAYSTYKDFKQMALGYPDFACPNTNAKLNEINKGKDKDSNFSASLSVKYKIYRQIMLASMEQILLSVPDRRDWLVSVELNVRCHTPYLASSDFTNKRELRFQGWTCPMRDLIHREYLIMRKEVGSPPDIRCSAQEWIQWDTAGQSLTPRVHIDFDRILGPPKPI